MQTQTGTMSVKATKCPYHHVPYLLVSSCRESDGFPLRQREHQHVDRHRGGDSPPRGHRHHFNPLLETVSYRQAGIPARRHDLHPAAEAEGRVQSVLYSV